MEATTISPCDRITQLKAFDDSKAGVQGLVENGVTKIPSIFHCGGHSHLSVGSACNDDKLKLNIPIIDLKGIHGDSVQRADVVDKVRNACEKWGFFQIINHGIPAHVLDEMIHGIRSFHEQDANERKEFYSRDLSRKVLYFSNYTLFRDPTTNWRDTLAFFMAPHPPKPQDLPHICRFHAFTS